MKKSTRKSGRIERNVRRVKRASLSLRGLVGLATSEQWLALPDTTVLVRAATGRRESPSRDFVEAAVAGLFVCVISNEMRTEVTEVLGRPLFGSMSKEQVDGLFGELWKAARLVAMAADDPKFLRFVRDEGDVPLLRTAMGTFFQPDLVAAPKKFIVSSDGRAFPPATTWNGFHCLSPTDFMQRLRDALG